MLKHLRRRLTILFSILTAAVLAAALTATCRMAQIEAVSGADLVFANTVSAIEDAVTENNLVRDSWLASQEACDKLPSGRAYNITNGEHRTLRSIVQKLIDELNIDCRIRSVPYPMLDMIARSMERLGNKSAKEPKLTHYGVSKLNFDFTLDTSRAQEELGYQPVVTLDEGIERTAAWLRDHGKLPR